ncbi:MAG TPA: PaaI family thioesterase [Bryobacteraceae bacterium]|nr:PaaI family thioesterase [Bryobacteraceae bacterium]
MSDGPLNQKMNRDQIQARLVQSPFNAFLNLEVVNADHEKQEVIMRLPMRPEFERLAGTRQWHGGPIMAAIDTVGDYALAMLFGKPLPTINLRVDYLRPGKDTLTLVALVRRSGKTVGVVDVNVLNEAGELVAIGRANYSTVTA